jgi:carbonic anhydrase
MKSFIRFSVLIFAAGLMCYCGQPAKAPVAETKTDSISKPAPIVVNNAEEAIAALQAGNKRFLDGKLVYTNYPDQIEKTKSGQKPHSVILSCMDSRVPPEIIFDQGIGNIFAIRVAGNIEDDNVLGSMEYAVEHAGSKLIVVLGHSHCGAVTGAVKDIKLGNLTQLVAQIKPALKGDPKDAKTIDETAKNNIKITIEDILKKSSIIKEMEEAKKIEIKGAFYDIETGVVTFME